MKAVESLIAQVILSVGQLSLLDVNDLVIGVVLLGTFLTTVKFRLTFLLVNGPEACRRWNTCKPLLVVELIHDGRCGKKRPLVSKDLKLVFVVNTS